MLDMCTTYFTLSFIIAKECGDDHWGVLIRIDVTTPNLPCVSYISPARIDVCFIRTQPLPLKDFFCAPDEPPGLLQNLKLKTFEIKNVVQPLNKKDDCTSKQIQVVPSPVANFF